MVTLLSIRENITAKPCIICNENSWQRIFRFPYEDRTFYVLRCLSCGHMLLDPVPLTSLNSRTMDAKDDEVSGSKFLSILHENFVIKKEIAAVRKYLPQQNARVLDIGCGTGWASHIWQKNGFAVTGLEPSQTRNQVAKEKYNVTVINAHIENFVTPEKFDMVIMRHLLEHIEEPEKLLTKVREFLKPDGLLLIIIPNINSIGRYVFQGNWEWVIPLHLHFYSPKTLAQLLEKAGYQKERIYQMPSPLWYPTALNNALFGEGSKRKLPNILALLLSLPIVLVGFILNLNDNMTLIFRNKK